MSSRTSWSNSNEAFKQSCFGAGERRTSSGGLGEEHALNYHGPTCTRERVRKWAAERPLEVNDPLSSLLKLSVMRDRKELYSRDEEIKEEERVSSFVHYLEVCLFSNATESGPLQKDQVMSLRNQVRNANVGDGVIDMEYTLPHPFATQSSTSSCQINQFQVVKTLDATSRPKMVRFFHKNPNGESFRIAPDVLYKTGDDLRQDLLILSCISGCNLALQNRWPTEEEKHRQDDDGTVHNESTASPKWKSNSRLGNVQLPQTPTYLVLPWGPNDGLIELVPNVSDQREWVDAFPAMTYLSSAAASVTVAWMFGLGDRHRRNILATSDGQVFNIDFRFAFGATPPLEGAAVPVPKSMYKDLKKRSRGEGVMTSVASSVGGSAVRSSTTTTKLTEQDDELWAVFVELCMAIFDQIAQFRERQSIVLEEMARLIEYQPFLNRKKKDQPSIVDFFLQQGSEEGRARFYRTVKTAPFSFRSKVKEAIIPVWYKQVKLKQQVTKQVPGSLVQAANAYRKKVQGRHKWRKEDYLRT